MKTMRVQTTRPYDIFIGSGLLDRAGELSREVNGGSRALIVTDSNVGPLYAARVGASLRAADYRTEEFVFPAGEGSKRLATVEQIYGALAAGGFTRADLVVALICNIFLNTLWLSMMSGKAMMVLLPMRVLKNLIKWPVDAALFYLIAKRMESLGLVRMIRKFQAE